METRKSSQHSVFGKELPHTMLPTNMEVAIFFQTEENASNKDEYGVVAEVGANLWKKASFPTILQKPIVKRVTVLIETGSKLCRSKN